MLKALSATIVLGAFTSTAILFGIPSLVEMRARESLSSTLPQASRSYGLDVSSASFNSIAISGLHTAFLGSPSFTIQLNQPVALFSRHEFALKGSTETFQATATTLSFLVGQGEGGGCPVQIAGMRLSPFARSQVEKELANEMMVDYQDAPVITLDQAKTLISGEFKPSNKSLQILLEKLRGALTKDGATTPFSVTGSLTIPSINAVVPLSVRQTEDRYQIVLDKGALSSLALRDPLSVAEITAYEAAPLSLSYAILLRQTAAKFAKRFVEEQPTSGRGIRPPSELAVRVAMYGYLTSRLLGPQTARQLGAAFAEGRSNHPSIGETEDDAALKARADELLEIGYQFAENDVVAPRDLPKFISKNETLMNREGKIKVNVR